MGFNSGFKGLKHDFHCTGFHETHISQINFVDIFGTELPKWLKN